MDRYFFYRTALVFCFILYRLFFFDSVISVGAGLSLREDVSKREPVEVIKAGRSGKRISLNGPGSNHHLTLDLINRLAQVQDLQLQHARGVQLQLVLLDAHSDSTPKEKIDCGSWVNHFPGKVLWLGGVLGLKNELQCIDTTSVYFSRTDIYAARAWKGYFKTGENLSRLGNKFQELRADKIAGFFGQPGYSVCWKTPDMAYPEITEFSGPVYLSIDLDVLSERYINSPWGNGLWSPENLREIIRFVASRGRIVEADICGYDSSSPQEVKILHEVCEELLKYM